MFSLMNRFLSSVIAFVIVLFLMGISSATVIDLGNGNWGDSITGVVYFHNNGNGLIYDVTNNITWLQNADYFDAVDNLPFTFGQAQNFVYGGVLGNYAGYSGWRFPHINELQSIGMRFGTNHPATAFDPFINVLVQGYNYIPPPLGVYYSSQGYISDSPYLGYAPGTNSPCTDCFDAYNFSYYGVNHVDTSNSNLLMFVWPVLDGNIGAPAAVPEPSTMLLLGSGLLGLWGARKKYWR